MNKVNIVNNVGTKIDVRINEISDNVIEIVINLPPCEKVKISDLKPGQIFTGSSSEEYIFLGFDENGVADILKKELLSMSMKFGDNNNFNGSTVDEYLKMEYLPKAEKDFGAENIVEREIDLTSFDGFDDYGKIRRKISLLNFHRYRKYRKLIGNNMSQSWWLIDPDSTPSGIGSDVVRCVGSYGDVGCGGCGWRALGVRPFLSLKSNTLVSLIK